MTKSDQPPSSPSGNHGLIVFGLDSIGKPKAARFTAAHSGVAKTAAAALKLQTHEITGDLEDLAKNLPVGRVHARGKAFIPYIKKDLYDRLVAVSAPASKATEPPKPATGHPTAPISASLPKDWSSIATGNLVIAEDPVAQGFWKAVVTNREGDTLTLRWLEYPKLALFQRPLTAVALAYPGQT